MRILSLLLLLSVSCQEVKTSASKEDEKKIDEVYYIFSKAYRDLDADLVRSIYADSAIYLSPGAPIQVGKSAFIDSFNQMFQQSMLDSASLEIEFRILRRDLLDKEAVDIGYYHLQQTRGSETVFTSVGKFITVLKEQTDGNWKFVADAYSQAPVDAW